MQILELSLKTHDLEAIRNFYVYELGFEALEDTDESIRLSVGNSHLVFSFDESQEHRYHFAFGVPFYLLSDVRAWLLQHTDLLEHDGETVIQHSAWNASALYCHDSVGNLIEFIAYHNQDHNTDIPFSVQSILGIVEVGLVVKHVDKKSQDLQETLGLAVWDEGDDEFKALGNEEGAFIFVKQKRVWFPTHDMKAHAAPAKVTIYSESQIEYHLHNTDYVICTLPVLSSGL